MNTTINNIAKTFAAFATSSKWSDFVVSNFDTGGGQLRGYTEI